MNPTGIDGGHWSRWRWVAVTLLILGGQVGWVFWLSEPLAPRSHPSVGGAGLTVWQAPARELAETSQVPWRSPTSFIGVGARSFSGPVWLRIPDLEHPLYHWDEPAPMLALSLNGMGWRPGGGAAPPPESVGQVVGKPLPVPQSGVAAPLPLPERPRLAVSGAIAARRVMTMPALPTWPHTNLLQATEVEVGVAPSGLVWSARLLTSSGLDVADQAAVGLVRAVRFEPEAGSERNSGSGPGIQALLAMAWGTLRFEWPPPPREILPAVPPSGL